MTESSSSSSSVDESLSKKLDQENLGGFFRGVAASFRSSIPALKSSVRYEKSRVYTRCLVLTLTFLFSSFSTQLNLFSYSSKSLSSNLFTSTQLNLFFTRTNHITLDPHTVTPTPERSERLDRWRLRAKEVWLHSR